MKLSLLLILIFALKAYSKDQESLSDELMGLETSEEFDESTYLEPLGELDIEQEDNSKFTQVDPDLAEEQFPDIKFEVVDKIRKTEVDKTNVLQRLLRPDSNRNFSYAEKEARKLSLKDVVKSGSFIGVETAFLSITS